MRQDASRNEHHFPMTIAEYEHDTATQEFADRGYDIKSAIIRRQRSFGNTLAVPHRTGARAEHVCTKHRRHFCRHTSRLNSHRPGATSIGERQNNQRDHVQCDRATWATVSRAHKEYLHALLGADGAPAYINFSSKGCACVRAHRPVSPYGYLVCVHSYK